MMWHIASSSLSATPQPDLAYFLTILNKHEHFFASEPPLLLARAPGRLDLMGGIADYSGSLVLELPLAAATWVAVQLDTAPQVTLLSTSFDPGTSAASITLTATPEITFDLALLQNGLTYADARTLLNADPQQAWTAYVIGVLLVLQHECSLKLDQGLRIFIHSDVPPGKGVSSSAALEVSTMQALSTLFQLDITGRQLAMLCQQVENLIVGAPCGIMDQMTSACGQQDSLLALLCQPAELQSAVALPSDVEVWGIDSGIRHAVTGADYGSVRVGAFMGYRIIAAHAGLDAQLTPEGRMQITDPHWQGYLANIPPSLWESTYRDLLPLHLTGEEFLNTYAGSTDTVTHIDPTHTYAVRQPTAHPIYEHHRVQLFRALLTQPATSETQLRLLGELMFQSHASYSACGLGSPGTDRLAELVRQSPPDHGLYGAKITGGGSGGTVAVLARRGSQPHIFSIVQQYTRETGYTIKLLTGSSPGAIAWGTRHLSNT